MDPVSQAIVGVAAAQAGAKSDNIKVASLSGCLGGMLADMDIFIRSAKDPLMNIEYHRHFTHSLIFIPVGGLITALLLWFFVRKHISFKQLYLFSTLGYGTAGLLDACTSYGTRLLWPFADTRIAWNIISIIDPVFTLTIIVLCVLALVKRRKNLVYAAIIFMFGYLGLGTIQHSRAMDRVQEIAVERGHHTAKRFTAKPSIANLLVFRTIYEYEGQYYIDAVRMGLYKTEVYPGNHITKYNPDDIQPEPPKDSTLAYDIGRFSHFSDHYLSWHPEHPNILADMRYAMLPHSIQPLWGIEINPNNTDRHTPFKEFTKLRGNEFSLLGAMLIGKKLQERQRNDE